MQPKFGAICFAAYVAASGFADVFAQGLPPLEAYGALPETSLVALSPDGTKIASRGRAGDRDGVTVIDLESAKLLTGASVSKVNPRRLLFANGGNLLLITGRTYNDPWVKNAFDFSQAHNLRLADGKIRVLLRNAKNVYPYQSGLGRIVGRSADRNTIYMPAYYDAGQPPYSLFAVRLDRRNERRIERGNQHTIDWFMDSFGVPIVREDFDDEDDVHRIWRLGAGNKPSKLLYEDKDARRLITPVGVSHDGESLVVIARSDSSDFDSYYLMNLASGELSGPILAREDAEIEAVITDINRVVHGVRYSGFFPSYYFFDEALNNHVEVIQQRLPGMSATLKAWSEDFGKLVFLVAGGWSSGHYLLFDGDDPKPVSIGVERPAITAKHVAKTYVESYEARDGLVIPALVTARESVYDKGDAPLIVMPHGGPESHDKFGFNWRAQYFASRGYVVLQPQFRGSSGFGNAYTKAGYGEWGGKMQTDLNDGVRYLVDAGIVDSARVCIVGASYGGYAALAAGAFSPDMYRCIVSIAGVSDLFEMLKSERSARGKQSWVLDYWSEQFGAGLAERDFLRTISPAQHADSFVAPVLLLHGKRDTVVTIDQSKRMNRALQKAGKDVAFIQLKGEDHWLTQSETRLKILEKIAAFVDEHL